MPIIKTLLLCINDKLKIKPLRKIIAKKIQLNYIRLSAILACSGKSYVHKNHLVKIVKKSYEHRQWPIKAIGYKMINYNNEFTINEFAFACSVLNMVFEKSELTTLESNIYDFLKFENDLEVLLGLTKMVHFYKLKKIIPLLKQCPELANYFEEVVIANSIANCDNSMILMKFLKIGFKNGYDFTNYLEHANDRVLIDLL